MDRKIQLTANTPANGAGGEFPADLLVQLDRSRPRSLRVQLERGLRQSIARGSLPPGTALPPSRVLAAELDVSRSLVVGAYEQLVIEGYLEARQGSGTRVRAQGLRGDVTGDGEADREVFWAGPGPATRDGGIRRSGLPDPALFPRSEWLRHYRDVLRDIPDDRLLYPPARGEPELRAALTAYLGRVRGVRTTPEQIVVCGGFSQAVTLLCRVLGRRGVTRIAVEDPCFSLYRRIIKSTGLEPVPVPVDGQGLRTARLAGLDVGAALLSPAHSYPSGAVLSADRRVELLEWARAADALVIEDDYDAELRYDRLPVGALQGLDPDHVIYGGTVSKVLSPALRLGWIAAPPRLTGDIARAKFFEDFATEALGQLTLARFIESGAFARHLRRVRPLYRARRDSLLAALRTHLPSVRPSGEDAGLHLLLRLPPGLHPARVAAAAARHGVQLEEAARYWADRAAAPPALLIGYGPQRESVLARGIEGLGKELGELARNQHGGAEHRGWALRGEWHAEAIFTVSLILFGVVALFTAIGVGTEVVASGEFGRWLRMSQVSRSIGRLSGHLVVCAYGRVGRAVVEELRRRGDTVVVIEAKPELEPLLDEHGVRYLPGDPADETVLRQAGIERARGLICAVDSDAANVYITLTARALNPDLRIVARASERVSIDKLVRAGADEVVSPYGLTGHGAPGTGGPDRCPRTSRNPEPHGGPSDHAARLSGARRAGRCDRSTA